MRHPNLKAPVHFSEIPCSSSWPLHGGPGRHYYGQGGTGRHYDGHGGSGRHYDGHGGTGTKQL